MSEDLEFIARLRVLLKQWRVRSEDPGWNLYTRATLQECALQVETVLGVLAVRGAHEEEKMKDDQPRVEPLTAGVDRQELPQTEHEIVVTAAERTDEEPPDDVVYPGSRSTSCSAQLERNGSTVFCNRRKGHMGDHWTHWALKPYYWTRPSGRHEP